MVGFISCKGREEVAFVTANNVHGTRDYPVLKFPVRRVIVRVNTTTEEPLPQVFRGTNFFHVRVRAPVFRIASARMRSVHRVA